MNDYDIISMRSHPSKTAIAKCITIAPSKSFIFIPLIIFIIYNKIKILYPTRGAAVIGMVQRPQVSLI